MDDATFETTVFHTGDSITLAVTGELDLLTGEQLRLSASACLAKEIRQLVVDLRHVTFCDCAGVNALLSARRQALAMGVDFVLAEVTAPRVARVLRLTGTGILFDLDLRKPWKHPGKLLAAAQGGFMSMRRPLLTSAIDVMGSETGEPPRHVYCVDL
ncbi:STAS domain-containing protein [Streptomyces glomeratus]|uniref:Anti-sigma factor antagonist n=1 Tax=Streptomyces glomeratus TaxID=284452 RepID=A0ABP6M723_9ACTN|nr:STAS domain-containing protein [Streptomyces glomeratus]MCF1512777.1 STAS domain-containing protein [Streptomyces glomeratus]